MKGTYIVRCVIGNYYLNELISTLQTNEFSLIIDETTDMSTLKQLVLLVRFCDCDIQKTFDKYSTLLEVTDCTCKGIFVGYFTKHEIPLKNLVGFASDNARVTKMVSKSC